MWWRAWLLSALGLYEPLVEWGGAGATVPLTGFGHNLAKGVREAVAADGWLGVFTGGLDGGGRRHRRGRGGRCGGWPRSSAPATNGNRQLWQGGRCRPVFILSFFCCSFLPGSLLYYGQRQISTERNIRLCAV